MRVAIVCNGQLGSAIRNVITRQKNRFNTEVVCTWVDDTEVGQTLSQGALPFSNFTPDSLPSSPVYISSQLKSPNGDWPQPYLSSRDALWPRQ